MIVAYIAFVCWFLRETPLISRIKEFKMAEIQELTPREKLGANQAVFTVSLQNTLEFTSSFSQIVLSQRSVAGVTHHLVIALLMIPVMMTMMSAESTPLRKTQSSKLQCRSFSKSTSGDSSCHRPLARTGSASSCFTGSHNACS